MFETYPDPDPMDVQKYLRRIGYEGEVENSLQCLTKLQHCHISSVPYENLDMFTNVRKVLDVNTLYEKIVLDNRGGWCSELNGLFYSLLQTIGFDVQVLHDM